MTVGKDYSWKKSYFLNIKDGNLSIHKPPRRTSELQEKPSALKREYPVLQN
jgi:hypothetical protein